MGVSGDVDLLSDNLVRLLGLRLSMWAFVMVQGPVAKNLTRASPVTCIASTTPSAWKQQDDKGK